MSDKDYPSKRRHVTWQGVAKRYRVSRSTLYGWKESGNTILYTEK